MPKLFQEIEKKEVSKPDKSKEKKELRNMKLTRRVRGRKRRSREKEKELGFKCQSFLSFKTCLNKAGLLFSLIDSPSRAAKVCSRHAHRHICLPLKSNYTSQVNKLSKKERVFGHVLCELFVLITIQTILL